LVLLTTTGGLSAVPSTYSFPSFQGEIVQHVQGKASHFGYIYSDAVNQRLRLDWAVQGESEIAIYDFKQNNSFVALLQIPCVNMDLFSNFQTISHKT